MQAMAGVDLPLTPRGQAQRILFALGLQAPGRRLIDFAVCVRASVDGAPDARIRAAMLRIEDGPVALVAENPQLQQQQVLDPVSTVAEAADAVVFTLGVRLLDAPEPPPVTLYPGPDQPEESPDPPD